MSSQQCPACGRQLKPNARFCSYCGVPLTQKPERQAEVQPDATSVPAKPTEEPVKAVEAISPSVEAAFIMRGKLGSLRSQKVAIEEEEETIKVKHLVGELTEKDAEKETASLLARLEPINREIGDLENKAITPLEQLQQEKAIQEGRLQRLEELRSSGEVDDAIYQRLGREYSDKLNETIQNLNAEMTKANHWLVQMEERKQKLEFDRETLQVRARIDEVSKRNVKNELKTIDDEINKITSVLAGLRSLLGTAAPAPKTPSLIKQVPQKSDQKENSRKCPHCQAKISLGSKYCYTCGNLL
ncbi:MAG: zinc-ribbon domain-containing protein [Candidatus Hodarchaeota archaeon]